MTATTRSILTFTLGALVGAVFVLIYEHQALKEKTVSHKQALKRTEDVWASQTYQATIIDTVNTLANLRKHDFDYLIAVKEKKLSEDIGAFATSLPNEILSDIGSVKVLKVAARYRKEHPFSTGEPDIDQDVERVLREAVSK